jgi:hypothetical protein
MILNKHFREFIELLEKHHVEYLVVGGYPDGEHPEQIKHFAELQSPEARPRLALRLLAHRSRSFPSVPRHSVGRRKFMSTNLICLLLGIAALLFWARGLAKGVMPGLVFGFVRREDAPVRFLACSVFYGAIAGALIVTPALAWMGVRG